MKNRNQQRNRQSSKNLKMLKSILRFLSHHQVLTSCSIICMVIVAGMLVVYRYGFLMTTEKDLHEKRTIEIGVSMKAPSEVIVIASSSSPVQEVFDKVAEINRLNRKLHGQPELPPEMLRPTSMKMSGTNDFLLEIRAQELDNSLDQELKRLQTLTGDARKNS